MIHKLNLILSFLLLISWNTNAQDKELKGTVHDEQNLPLPGVNVKLLGSTTIVATDMDGNFTLSIPATVINPEVEFSFISYVTKTMLVAGLITINVKLEPDNQVLEEIVVVGYGTQKKKDLTGAVSTANLEAFKNAPNVNIIQSLQGTVPGLNIGQVNSAGSTPSINIRGINTLGGASTTPLIILDGAMFTGSITSLNPDDIESIDVLKDASSAAVYGAQAANGVILITSKKGRKNNAPTISYKTSYTTQTPTVGLRPMNREEYIDKIRYLYYDQAFLAPDFTIPNPDFNPVSFLDGAVIENGSISDNNFNWWEAATRTGDIIEHNVSVSGGGDKVTYLLSAGNTDQKGYIMNDNYSRTTVRANIDVDLKDFWKVGMQSFATFSDYSGAEPTLNSIVRHSPLLTPFDDEGNLIATPTGTVLANPFTTYYVDDYDKQTYLFANFYSDLKLPFIKGLSYRINFGNTYRSERHYFASEYGAGQTGNAYKNNNLRYDYTFDNIVTYQRTFAKKHDITVTGLYGVTERSYENTSASANGFTSLTLGYNNLQQGTNQFASSGGWQESLNYQMGRVNYKFDDKYMLTGTIRRDGFTGFAANEKWGVFPSVSAAWVVSNENFMSKLNFIEFFKLRGGYGSVGNLIGRYASLSRINRDDAYVFGDGGSTQFGQQLSSLENANLKWESTKGVNLGVDFSFFKGKLTGNVEYYNTETENLFFPRSIPSLNGVSSITVNLGNINNKGVEFVLTSKNIDSKDFSWSTTLNFSRNTNKIVKLSGQDADGDGREDDILADGYFMGESIGTIFGYKRGAMYQIGDDIPEGFYPGTYSIVDVNGDGQITIDDRVKQGRSEPAYRAGLLNTFKYKDFTLTVFLNTVQGGKDGYLQSNTPNIGSVRDQNAILLNYFAGVDYWSPSNPGGKFPRSILNPQQRPLELQDRSFVRLQDISLSYNLPADVFKGSFISSASLFVSGKNLATWTKWDGWDPETGQGYTDSGRPVMKGYSVGLNVTF